MNKQQSSSGFTLIELLVVMAIIATLLTIAVPRYFHSLEKSKAAVLQQDLQIMRDAIDKYYADNGSYPEHLDDLVSKKYLRKIPIDPLTDSAQTWISTPPPADASPAPSLSKKPTNQSVTKQDAAQEGIYDIHSGAVGNASDGTPYSTW